jgi:hypothetical protein
MDRMTRTLVCLAAAMGMLMFAGCGEVPGGGVALATNSAPPKPAPPAPGDQDQKPTPPPLIPSALPSVQPTDDQPTGVAPLGTSPAIGENAAGPSPGITPPVAPPASGVAEFAQSIFGGAPAAKTPAQTPVPAATPAAVAMPPVATSAPNPHRKQTSDPAVEIKLSEATVSRINKDAARVEVAYAFFQGRPNFSKLYTLVVHDKADAAAPTNDSQTILEGRSLSLNGKFKCLANLRPATAAVEIVVWEGTAAEPRGRKISNVVEVSIRPDLGQEGTGDLRPAGVGVGAQGKGYGAGIITTPIGALFTAKEQIAFGQIQHDLKIFNAQNNRNPSSQEEFMEKIIKDGGIKLPELPAGEIYVYDPQSGELKVGHEKK